jgi:general stress protein YciG
MASRRGTKTRLTNTDEENSSSSRGKMTVEEAGRKGGEVGGHKGGEATLERHGPEFYSEIGKKGGEQVREAFEAKRKEEGNE